MKKIVLLIVLFFLLSSLFVAWKLFGPATAFNAPKYYLYVKTGMTFDEELKMLKEDQVLQSPSFFNWLAKKMDYPQNIRAGKYEIKSGESLFSMLRMLRNGKQLPVNLVIIKFRTKEDLASYTGKRFECDSLAMIKFLDNNDSLATYGLDSNNVMTAVFPNTYTFFWNTTPSRIFKKLLLAHNAFWTNERREQAKALGLNPATTYTLASLVEEETTRPDDKPKIASVYLNRMAKGMKLAADPTIKYAMRNFELKRIYEKYLSVESPYNTYKYFGLPPGPICTPTVQTIDAVLHAPKTDYIYFVAKPDFSGYSNFASDYTEHLKYAKEYQKALDVEMAKKASGKLSGN